MPINPSKEQVQGTGTDLTGSVESGQRIATAQISNAFNYGTEAQDLRRRAVEMEEASTASNIISQQGNLEIAQAKLPSDISVSEAQARNLNASAATEEASLQTPDAYRERYAADTAATKAQRESSIASARSTNASAQSQELENDQTNRVNQSKNKTPGYHDRVAASQLKNVEGAANSAEGAGKTAQAQGDAEPKNQILSQEKQTLANQKAALENEALPSDQELDQKQKIAQTNLAREQANEIKRGKKTSYHDPETGKLVTQSSLPERSGSSRVSPADKIINAMKEKEDQQSPLAMQRARRLKDELDRATQTAETSAIDNKSSAQDQSSAANDYPLERIAKSIADKSEPNQSYPLSTARDQMHAAKVEAQKNTSGQASAMTQNALARDTEGDLDQVASLRSMEMIDPNAYIARQKRVAEAGLFQSAAQVNEMDSQLLSVALDGARADRAGKRQVNGLKKAYSKELRYSTIVDSALDVMQDADPRVAADFVGTIPDDKEIRKELGFEYFASIQSKLAETMDPSVKKPLSRELAKQAIAVFPSAVSEVGSFWNSNDLVDPNQISASTFNKDVSQLSVEERNKVDLTMNTRAAFQQASKKLGIGSGKIEDLFSVSSHDLDYYAPNDPVRMAAERAMARMGPGAIDGTFIMKRHGSGYHAAFAPSSDALLSRQALSVQDALFQYRTALHSGDEGENLQAAGITEDTLSRLNENDSQALSLTYGMFPYKEALPGMVKSIVAYKEKALALGDSHELRNEFQSQMTDVIMYQTKPGLEYNDPNKRPLIMSRLQEFVDSSYPKINKPVDKLGRTRLTVRGKFEQKIAEE